MFYRSTPIGFMTRLLFGFIAGFLATLIFHQLTLAILWGIGLAPFKPFSMVATQPFGVPAVISLAFWGGIWGILFVLIEGRFPPRGAYWVMAFLFGALPAFSGRSFGRTAAQGPAYRGRLAPTSALDGISDQRRMGYWYRIIP
jgi:hypothetical protein